MENRYGPLALIGGSDVVLGALNDGFPGTKFRVFDDAIGVFVYYTANLPGAPSKSEVQQALALRFGPEQLFKIPTIIRRPS